MSFTDFTRSDKGSLIGAMLRDPDAIRRMEAYSAAGRPALLAVAAQIESAKLPLSNTEKQHVGRWVHRLLGPRGWRPVDKKRMPGGGQFATAAVYKRVTGSAAPEERSAAAPAATDPASRLRTARERVRVLPVKPQGVKAFIAEKRRSAKSER